jgi:hypothetical protein
MVSDKSKHMYFWIEVCVHRSFSCGHVPSAENTVKTMLIFYIILEIFKHIRLSPSFSSTV